MSAIHATSKALNRINVASSSGFKFGPVSRQLFRLGPPAVLAEASKTGRQSVVS